MSEFYVSQPALSQNTRTLIKNSQGTPLFLMIGRFGTRGDVLSLYKMNGDLAASIKQTTFAPSASFDLYLGFEKVGSMRRIFNFPSDFYYIRQLNWAAVGNIPEHHYAIFHLHQKVMTMQEVLFSNGTYCELSIQDDQDAPLCICVAAVLNYWVLNRKKNFLKLGDRALHLDPL